MDNADTKNEMGPLQSLMIRAYCMNEVLSPERLMWLA